MYVCIHYIYIYTHTYISPSARTASAVNRAAPEGATAAAAATMATAQTSVARLSGPLNGNSMLWTRLSTARQAAVVVVSLCKPVNR